MATKKQRRRREKERRHEYETVYVDEQGEEVEVDEPDAKAKSTRPEERKTASGGTGRGGRVVEPPSWNKVIRRGSIFAPFIVIFLYLVRPKDASTVAVVAQAVVLIVLLVPFMYLVDSMAYRSYEKRMAKRRDTPPKTK